MAYDKFNILTSTAVPLSIENVDTDQIIPARFLKATERVGFGDNLSVIGDTIMMILKN
jgi:3-isopropylmalate/(R)-2-methylmalate dehydratase small subunit